MSKNTLKPVTSQLCLMDALLKKEGVYPLSANTVSYVPTDNLATYLPLVVQERDTEILVTLQDDVPEDKLAVFSEELANQASYYFSKDALLQILDEEADLLFEITALLEKWSYNEFVSEEKLLLILSTLKDANVGIARALLVLSAASTEEINKLFVIADELPTHIHDYFTRIICSRHNSEDDNYDTVFENACERYKQEALYNRE